MQSKLLKVLTVGAVSMCAVCSVAGVAYAEGSKDLVNNRGYRPYLEWNSKTNLEMTRENVIYVYANAGETIYFGSSENAANEATIKAIGGKGTVEQAWYSGTDAVGIAVTLPNTRFPDVAMDPANTEYQLVDNDVEIKDITKTYLFKVDKSENGVGYISSVAQESAGPKVDGTGNGYNPLSFTAPYTGTYSFRFLSSLHDDSSDPAPVLSTATWDSNGGTVAAFDVTVYSSDQTAQRGRVWADRLFLNSGSWNSDEGIYSKYYVLTDDAFAYEVDLNGMSSWGFVLYSNKRGFLWDPENAYTDNSMTSNLQSLNRSFYSSLDNKGIDVGEPPVFNNGKIYANYEPLTNDDKTYKLFFNNPSENTDVLQAYTDATALAGDTSNPISDYKGDVTKSFADGRDDGNNNDGAKGTVDNPFKSTIGYGGTFTVSLAGDYVPDTLSLQLDFSAYKLEDANKYGGLTEAANVPVLDDNGEWVKLADNETSAASEQNVVTLTATNNGSGKFTLTWSGLDAYGNIVPAGKYSNCISLFAAHGVAHFPMIDVENSPNGVQIMMLNNIEYKEFSPSESTKDKYTVYYNNSKFSELFNPNTAFSSEQLGDNKNAASGVSSEIVDGKSSALRFDNQDGNCTALDIWADLYDEIEKNITIEVTEHPVLYPILSYVAENNGEKETVVENDSAFDGTLDSSTKSHVWYNSSTDSIPQNTNAVGGIYGNTISTGFAAYLQNVSAYSVRNNILWTVTIPVPSSIDDDNDGNVHTGTLYVKDYVGTEKISDSKGNEVSADDLTLSAAFTVDTPETVITDTESATILNGSIKQINSFSDGTAGDIKNATMKLYDNQGTVITGRGTVLYGLVIDRIYAPDATATVEYVHGWDNEAGWTDITDSKSETNPVHSVNAGKYATSTDNIYYNLLQAQPQSEE